MINTKENIIQIFRRPKIKFTTFQRILKEKLNFFEDDMKVREYFQFYKADLPGSKVDLAPLYLLVNKMNQ